MTVKVSTTHIWWDDAGDNKPSVNYFESFKGTMFTRDLKVNQKGYSIIEVLQDNTNITYIWINDGKYNYYYYYNRIVKVMNNLYLVEYVLDVFTTFTLPYLDHLKRNRTTVKINRHKDFTLTALTYEDEMLNAIPKIVKSKKQWYGDNLKARVYEKTTPITGDKWWVEEIQLNEWTWGRRGGKFFSEVPQFVKLPPFVRPVVYLAFSDLTPATNPEVSQEYKINLVPILSYNASSKLDLSVFPEDNQPAWYIAAKKDQKQEVVNLHNDYKHLVNTVMKTYPSKCTGLFLGPPFWFIQPKYLNVFYIENKDKTKQYSIYVQMKQEGVPLVNTANHYFMTSGIDYIDTSAPDRLNKSDKLSIYASNVINFKINDKDTKYFKYIDANSSDRPLGTKLYAGLGGGCWFNYTSDIFFINQSRYYGVGDEIMSYIGYLPLYFDKYQEYVQNTRNTRDTGLNIAAQQMGLGIAKNYVNGVFSGNSFVSGAMSFNPEQMNAGAKGVIDSGFGIIQSVLGYVNKKNMVEADLKDKRMSLNTEIRSGNVSDAGAVGVIMNSKKIPENRNYYMDNASRGDFYQCDEFTTDTIKALNNVLYLYGQYNPRIGAIGDYMYSGSSFDYIMLDSEYLSNIFATTIRAANGVPLQREYYSTVYNYLTAGLRLWNEQPRW